MSRLEEIRNQRLEKLAKLRELGINPYPSQSQKDQNNQVVVDNFAKFEGKTLSLTGRLMSIRSHGKLAFADLADQSGKIQLVLRESQHDFPDLGLLDAGDFVMAKGEIIKTKTGAISLDVIHLTLLTKSLRPLPDSWDGLKDKETIFRRRYLDLVMNPDRRSMFERKAKFWLVARNFMADNGFLEVETPVLEHVTGGADASPFKTHHHALDTDFYLRISTELYLKRLIGGGFEKVYTLAPNFRNEGIDDEHLQEYYQLEWYWAYADYRDNMELTKNLFIKLAKDVYGKTKFTRGKHTFDLAGDWEEIDYAGVIKDKLGIDIFTDSDKKMAKVLLEHRVKLDGGINKARLVDNLWKIIRTDVAGPAFLINTPKFISPLAKSIEGKEDLTERYQIILAGSELSNGYSELNDPIDQLERFREQQMARDAGDDEAQMLDIDFVEMLEYGMPPTSGLGVSERLFWFLERVTAREGTLFPQTRHHIDPLTRQIYDLPDDHKSDPESYDYKSRKIIALVDTSLSNGLASNALGHLAFAAGNRADDSWMGRKQLKDADGQIHRGIAKYPFVVLGATREQISSIRGEALLKSMEVADYVEEMFKTGHDDQLAKQVAKNKTDNLQYHAILMTGSSSALDELTKGLKLYGKENK